MQTTAKQNVALSSVFASFGLTVMKLIVGILSMSIGIISEAAHSALDLGAALLTYFAVKAGDKPADEDHHYGHGKIESVSALIETGLLFITSGWIIYESIERLMSDSIEIETTWYTFAVIIISIVVDFSRSRALTKVAKETNSQALEADALHFSSDILSSIVVLIGLALVAFGIKSADAYAAIGVSIFVAYAGYNLGKRTLEVLTDAAPKGLRESITEIVKTTQGVITVEKVRVRPIGIDTFIDMTVYVSRTLPLIKAHEITNLIIEEIRKEIPGSDITIHLKPLPLDSETIIEQVKIVASRHELHISNVIIHTQNKQKNLSYQLEVNPHIKLKEAHKIATDLEQRIQEEIDKNLIISTHIEPVHADVVQTQHVSGEENKKLQDFIISSAQNIKLIRSIHDLKISKCGNKFFISCHAVFEGDVLLEDVHQAADVLEFTIKSKWPHIGKIVIHTEPQEMSSGRAKPCHDL